MKKFLSVMGLLVVLLGAALAKPPAKVSSTYKVPAFPGTLVNARYVYVTSYDGDQFNPNLLPDDRHAINAVQDAIQKWGKFIVVYRPQEADMVLMVQSRPSEDVLAVYDGFGWPNHDYLWRVMGAGGLQANETPLVTQMEKAFAKAANR